MISPRSESTSFDVNQFQIQVLPVLVGWGLGSLVAGLIWLFHPSAWMRGFGSQFAGWGLVDALIALFSLRSAYRKLSSIPSESPDTGELSRQAQTFERVLWVNAGLDVGYVTGGSSLAVRHADNQFRRGIGWGIIGQGMFLLVWDVLLALIVRGQRHGS